ncbi:MAG TPA: fumarylacetoacetate hydrolase family protein [Burkholderiales bacterium]|nr:fumarylacetoacetate hydrolase family protein [Burkholderiales bacterium]
MTDFVIEVGETPSLPVIGRRDRFPVHRIYCLGRNYAAHAPEMGKDPEKEAPFFFLKPADAIVPEGGEVHYPPGTSNLHYEIELVVALHRGGFQIPAARALDHVYGYAVGLDMTRRDLQLQARDMGRPWDFGKAFDESAPITAIHPVASQGHHSAGAISLTVNGELRQKADLQDMIWNIPDTLAFLSNYYHLRAGDLIFTGTPAGVGAVVRGDKLVGHVEGLAELRVTIA